MNVVFNENVFKVGAGSTSQEEKVTLEKGLELFYSRVMAFGRNARRWRKYRHSDRQICK